MFRTIKVKLAQGEECIRNNNKNSSLEPILKTAVLYNKACQIALDYGFKKKTYTTKAKSMLVLTTK